MSGVCTTCMAMSGGGVEFFEENVPYALSKSSISCQKDYNGCVYSAQGAIMCNLQQKQSNNKNIKETFVPGMVIGGLPNIPSLPNFKNTPSDKKQFY